MTKSFGDLSNKIYQATTHTDLTRTIQRGGSEKKPANGEADRDKSDDGQRDKSNIQRAYRKAKDSKEDIKVDLGDGDDIFTFGHFDVNRASSRFKSKFGEQREIHVDMGDGDGDVVRLVGTIEDYTIDVLDAKSGVLTFTHQTTGQVVSFANAEKFVFDNRIWSDGQQRHNKGDSPRDGVVKNYANDEFSFEELAALTESDISDAAQEAGFERRDNIDKFGRDGDGDGNWYVTALDLKADPPSSGNLSPLSNKILSNKIYEATTHTGPVKKVVPKDPSERNEPGEVKPVNIGRSYQHDENKNEIIEVDLGNNDDVFTFGHFDIKSASDEYKNEFGNQRKIHVDMGEGDGDVVKLGGTIQDYIIDVSDSSNGFLTFTHKTTGQIVRFENAEKFVFLNRIWNDGQQRIDSDRSRDTYVDDYANSQFTFDELASITDDVIADAAHIASDKRDANIDEFGGSPYDDGRGDGDGNWYVTALDVEIAS